MQRVKLLLNSIGAGSALHGIAEQLTRDSSVGAPPRPRFVYEMDSSMLYWNVSVKCLCNQAHAVPEHIAYWLTVDSMLVLMLVLMLDSR